MLKKILWVICICMLFNHRAVAEDANYAMATGESDKERLTILNEIYNPFSLQFFKQCNIPKGARVLELGCGIGLMSQVFANAVGEEGFVLATDISAEQLQVAQSLLPKEKCNLEFRQLSAYEMDDLNEQFDVVCARFLLVHLQNPQLIIQKIKKVLKPGGMLIIEDITANHTMHSVPHTEGMAILANLDLWQCEIQQSDDQYFASFPKLLEKEGFKICLSESTQPMLDTPRKRKSISFHLFSLKNAILNAGKITGLEYEQMLQKVYELEKNTAIEIHYYELGQLCVTF